MSFYDDIVKNWLKRHRSIKISRFHTNSRDALFAFFQSQGKSSTQEKIFLKNQSSTHDEKTGDNPYDSLLQDYVISLVLYIVASKRSDCEEVKLWELLMRTPCEEPCVSKQTVIEYASPLLEAICEDNKFYTLLNQSDFFPYHDKNDIDLLEIIISPEEDFDDEDFDDDIESERYDRLSQTVDSYTGSRVLDPQAITCEMAHVLKDYERGTLGINRLVIQPALLIPIWFFLVLHMPQRKEQDVSYNASIKQCLILLEALAKESQYYWSSIEENETTLQISGKRPLKAAKYTPDDINEFYALFLQHAITGSKKGVFTLRGEVVN